jgi:flavin reductase (DIM6/NTAB) family NADH-FMN oxidoreductase RutF
VKHYNIAEINTWERFRRANFVNSLSGFRPVSLIATTNSQGISNLGVFSNIVHLGADPALIAFVNRPREAAPHTIRNIESRGTYTINHIHPAFVEKAHQCSAKYPDEVNEFHEVGLTPDYKDDFKVPYVAESMVQLGMELSEIIPMRNGTFLVIGNLVHAYVSEETVGSDGFINLAQADSLVSLGLDAYYQVNPLQRFTYAKPDRAPGTIPF